MVNLFAKKRLSLLQTLFRQLVVPIDGFKGPRCSLFFKSHAMNFGNMVHGTIADRSIVADVEPRVFAEAAIGKRYRFPYQNTPDSWLFDFLPPRPVEIRLQPSDRRMQVRYQLKMEEDR